jgi:hypothetical protein
VISLHISQPTQPSSVRLNMFMDESAFELDDLEKDLAAAGLGPDDDLVVKPSAEPARLISEPDAR